MSVHRESTPVGDSAASEPKPIFPEELVLKFQKAVLGWFAVNGRDLPWRRTANPFHLIVAESLLRQTQAERVVKPYLELISTFPDIQSLANASVNNLRLWFKPLGLFTRADRLIETAKLILTKHSGRVPDDLRDLQALPGLGIYSARAVLCLGFGVPVPMIDEGSGRVFRRVLGLISHGPAYSDRSLLGIAAEMLPSESSREFNLGTLDIASAYCHVQSPKCPECPLLEICLY
jgi:A/G-specific adenine glycosylase